MLRRTQPISSPSAGTEEPTGAPGQPFVERRKSDRRGVDQLRAEALQAVISRVEDRNFGGLRTQVHWSQGMKRSRILLLAVAVVAGGMAAFLATQRDQVVTEAVAKPALEVIAEPTMQVLVARAEIGAGQRLTAASMGWQEWPLDAVHPEFLTQGAAPDAITEVEGSVARSDFVAGEPIRQQKLSSAPEGSQLSAVLGVGKRAVSVTVAAESASGGFIAPNDRVDVLLTRSTDSDQWSDTILGNVRVLAINAQLGISEGEALPDQTVFTDHAIATLELDPTQTEVIMTAVTLGRLSLVLRPMSDGGDPLEVAQQAANQAIRMSSPFWQK